MRAPYRIPKPQDSIARPDGRPSMDWWNFLNDLAARYEGGDAGLQAEITAIARALGSPDGTVAKIPPIQAADLLPDTTQVIGQQSIRALGTLASGQVVLTLQGDQGSPGATYYYGTDTAGTKGWHLHSMDSLSDVDLITLPPVAGDALVYTGTDWRPLALTTTNVPEGSRLYHTAVRVRDTVLTGLSLVASTAITAADSVLSALGKLQAQIGGLIVQTITNGDTTHAPSGDAVFDALALKAPLLRPQFTDWIGIGTPADRPIAVSADSNTLPSGSASAIIFGSFNKERLEMRSASGDPTFQAKRSSGTIALPTATASGTSICNLAGSGYDGVDWVVGNRAIIRFRASENWTTTAQGTEILFGTSTNGTAANVFRWNITNDGNFVPVADNAYNVGSAAIRARVAYFATDTINTSDGREKSGQRTLTQPELAAARELAQASRLYQWHSSIKRKGAAAARWHFTPEAQNVIAIMQKHGLDALRYGFVCYDAWGETPEVRNRETGEVMQEFRPAGDRYGLRPAQLSNFVAAGLASRLDALEAKVVALLAPIR